MVGLKEKLGKTGFPRIQGQLEEVISLSDKIWSLCSFRTLVGGRTSDGAVICDCWYRKDPWKCQKVLVAVRR